MYKAANKYLKITCITLTLMVVSARLSVAVTDGYKLITYTTEDGGVIEASFFEAGHDHVVIFAHGAIFNKESWYFMAKKLQTEGIASLSLDFRGYGNSKKGTTEKLSYDILGAIDYVKGIGFKKISIVGGSMGGAAVLNALESKTDAVIDKVALLAPAGGTGITSKSVKKLFVVSKDEGLFSRVTDLYIESTQPKELKVYPGSIHAQHMFKSEYGAELTKLIINFLKS